MFFIFKTSTHIAFIGNRCSSHSFNTHSHLRICPIQPQQLHFLPLCFTVGKAPCLKEGKCYSFTFPHPNNALSLYFNHRPIISLPLQPLGYGCDAKTAHKVRKAFWWDGVTRVFILCVFIVLTINYVLVHSMTLQHLTQRCNTKSILSYTKCEKYASTMHSICSAYAYINEPMY